MHNYQNENSFRCIGSLWDKEDRWMKKTEETIKQFQLDFQMRLQPQTLRSYIHSVKQLLSFTEKPIHQTLRRDIRHWLIDLSDQGYKPTSSMSKLIGLKAFFKYCYEEELMSVNPVKSIRFPKRDEVLPRYLSNEQLMKLRKLVEGSLEERAMIEVLFSTGIRVSELKAMKKTDINWSEKTIIIPEGKGKKGRIVLFNQLCAVFLQKYLESRTDDLPFVFVNPRAERHVRTQTIHERFQMYSSMLGFRVTPHMLRYTFTAHLARRGMGLEAIRKLLGHESIHTTHLYARLFDHVQKEQYDKWM